MAASYSSFLTTPFYSPVFNTALFDGPFRIYFSQSYESVALKIYHLLQTEHYDLWVSFKKWSEKTKDHAFILIYPSADDVQMAFQDMGPQIPVSMEWVEGFVVGLNNPTDEEIFKTYFSEVVQKLSLFIQNQSHEDIQI